VLEDCIATSKRDKIFINFSSIWKLCIKSTWKFIPNAIFRFVVYVVLPAVCGAIRTYMRDSFIKQTTGENKFSLKNAAFLWEKYNNRNREYLG
jgi:hypothetical protein